MTTAMPPTSSQKEKQFAFVLSKAEFDMLTELAAHEDMTKAHLLRFMIRKEYLKAFPNRRPGRPVPATLRGLVSELGAAEHRTIGNIAERTGIPVDRVEHYLMRVQTKTSSQGHHVFERVDGGKRRADPNSTWELAMAQKDVLAAIRDAGFDVDEPLVTVNPDADDDT